MKIMSFVVLGVMVGIGLLGASGSAQAYEASAISLSPTQTLLVTTFNENLLNRDSIVPMLATVGTKGTHKPLLASFELRNSDGTSSKSQTNTALILSNQPIQDGGYVLEAGKRATFMMIAIITHPASTTLTTKAHLTSLPILLTKNGKVDSQTIKTY